MRMRRGMLPAVVFALLAPALAACGGGKSDYSTGPAATPGTTGGSGNVPPNTIQATEFATFSPTSLTVARGTTVTFAFASLTHNVTFSGAGAPTNIPDTSNGQVPRNFPNTGVFAFTCTIHGSYMTGQVTVQ